MVMGMGYDTEIFFCTLYVSNYLCGVLHEREVGKTHHSFGEPLSVLVHVEDVFNIFWFPIVMGHLSPEIMSTVVIGIIH